MVDIKIEDYRGFEIFFNTERERFTYKSDASNWSEKQSYSACKKSIDDFIKSNSEFIPFDVINESGKRLTIIGIRKDQRFISLKDGVKDQISEYHEKEYHLYEPKIHDLILANIAVLEIEEDELRQKIRDEKAKINTPNLRELKRKYLI